MYPPRYGGGRGRTLPGSRTLPKVRKWKEKEEVEGVPATVRGGKKTYPATVNVDFPE